MDFNDHGLPQINEAHGRILCTYWIDIESAIDELIAKTVLQQKEKIAKGLRLSAWEDSTALIAARHLEAGHEIDIVTGCAI